MVINNIANNGFWGVHSHGGTPIAGWFIYLTILRKWMIKWGTPIFGNPQIGPEDGDHIVNGESMMVNHGDCSGESW